MLFRSDRKSTRLNSSHTIISYAVFCLKKKRYSQIAAAYLFIGVGRRGPSLPRGPPPARPRARAAGLRPRDGGIAAALHHFFLKVARPPEAHPFPPREPLPS